jgi:hypothetical protein
MAYWRNDEHGYVQIGGSDSDDLYENKEFEDTLLVRSNSGDHVEIIYNKNKVEIPQELAKGLSQYLLWQLSDEALFDSIGLPRGYKWDEKDTLVQKANEQLAKTEKEFRLAVNKYEKDRLPWWRKVNNNEIVGPWVYFLAMLGLVYIIKAIWNG